MLSYDKLVDLVRSGYIDCDISQVNAASIDVHIGDHIMIESPSSRNIELDRPNDEHLKTVELFDHGYLLRPGEIFLAATKEKLTLPDNIVAHFILKSSVGRCFLNHLQSVHIDPGFYGHVTLELVNMNNQHSIRIKPNTKIGQLVFYEVDKVPAHISYSQVGQYNNSTSLPIQNRGAR